MRNSIKTTLTALAAVSLWACMPPQEESKDMGFSVDGMVNGADGDTVYLKLIKESGYEFIDSAIVAKDGKFTLRGNISKPDFYILHFSDPDRQITLIPDTCEHIKLSANFSDFADKYSVSGSPESENVCNIVTQLSETRKISDSLGVIFRNNINAPNLAGIKLKLDSVYNQAFGALRKNSVDFLKNHPNSLAQIICLSQYIGPRTPVFDAENDMEYYEESAKRLNEIYPDNFHTKKLVSYVERIKLSKKGDKPLQGTIHEGMTAPEIALKNFKGDTVRLSSLKGKYILLDFWASWSDVSAKNSENLNKLYWKYYNNNFAVYQVSLDERFDAWKSAYKEQKLSWISVSDLKNWNSKAALDYGVKALPASFLIYPDFTIHETNMPVEELDARLEKLVGKPIRKPVKTENDTPTK